MDVGLPSSRSPRALRGDTLRSALQELRPGDDVPPADSTGWTLRSALPPPVVLPDSDLDGDEPAPSALRPDELARWLATRG
ncbi:MAG TPA: hypothetical protein VHS09_06185 [Polyangiaceae bacterium]|nr:hypothetical protein [Polyangiaceae bacterium]